jgi:phage-related protein
MLGFVKQIWHELVSDITSVYHWALAAVAAVYSFVDRTAAALWIASTQLFHSMEYLYRSAWHYITVVYTALKTVVDVVIRNLQNYVETGLKDVLGFATSVYHTLVTWVEYLEKLVTSAISDISHWVITEIYDPLVRTINTAIQWILHEGTYAYHLLTNPELLVDILGGWLWGAWSNVLINHSAAIMKWLLHSMRGMIGEVLDVLEKFISDLV